MRDEGRFGVSPALLTAFDGAGEVDAGRMAALARRCLERGCASVTVFGTTGEGPSVAAAERHRAADELLRRGLPPERLVEGVIASSAVEAAGGVRAALGRGSRAVLLAPPFYFRHAGDEGVLAWYGAVFDRVGAGLRDILLYHIPGMTGVGLSPELVGRLRDRYGPAVLGVKDSGADPAATERLLRAHPDLTVLVGDESYLGRACALGARGTICGLANLVPERIVAAVEGRADDPLVAALVEAMRPVAFVAAAKALLARELGDPAWARPRPPLTPLDGAALARIVPAFDRLARGADRGP